MSDYTSSFKKKEFDLKLEDDYEVDSDLLKITTSTQEKQTLAPSHPMVAQRDEYDGYVKPEEPFSLTDTYDYAF